MQVRLSELSPVALWLFNTRNLSTSTTARLITLMLHVGPDSRAEHNAKHLLTLAIAQMPNRPASNTAEIAESEPETQLKHFWTGIKTVGLQTGDQNRAFARRPEVAGRWMTNLLRKRNVDLNICFPEVDDALHMLFAATLHHEVHRP